MAPSEKKNACSKRKEDRGLFCSKLQVRRKLLVLGQNSNSDPSRLFPKGGEGGLGGWVIRAVFTSS